MPAGKGYTLEELKAMGAKPVSRQGGLTLAELQAMGAKPVTKPEREIRGTKVPFPAKKGGVKTIPGNVARTFGNIPSSFGRFMESPVGPIGVAKTGGEILGAGVDIARTVATSPDKLGTLRAAKQGVDETVQGGAKGILKGIGSFIGTQLSKGQLRDVETRNKQTESRIVKEIADKRKRGEDTTALVSSLRGLVDSRKGIEDIIGKESERKTAGQITSDIASFGIEDPVEAALVIGEPFAQTKQFKRVSSLVGEKTKEVVGTAKETLANKIEGDIEKNIVKRFESGVKPHLPSRATPAKVAQYKDDVITATKTISDNKADLKFVDDLGDVSVGRNPQSLQELSEGLEQTKGTIFHKYDSLAKEAGEEGLSINISKVADELDEVVNSQSLALTNPNAIKYAEDLQERLRGIGELGSEVAQDVVKQYNKSLEAFYRNPSYDNASRAAIDALVVNNVRKSLDAGITGITGASYQALKNQYKALKTIERDVIKAALREARRNNKGLIDYTDIFTGSEVVAGIATVNPTLVAKGAFGAGIKEFYKYLNSPSRAVKKMFQSVEKLPQSRIPKSQAKNPSTTGGKNLLPTNPKNRTNNAPSNIDIPKSNRTLPKKSSEAGFISLTPFKNDTELTTKILQKLEGKTTVSKQFISDLTNSGDLKQVERELIRELLEKEGKTVNVAEFAAKVRGELLPLKVAGRDSSSYQFENVALPDDVRGNIANYDENIYESPIKTSAGDVHFSDQTDNYFGHTRIEDMADDKTRRVIEVQSDLYQKGRLESEVISYNKGDKLRYVTKEENVPFRGDVVEVVATTPSVNGVTVKWPDGSISTMQSDVFQPFGKTGKTKLSQYNNPTAHFRMVREEIKKASQDGKTKLQFPTGETAMKVEGLGIDSSWQSGTRQASIDDLIIGEQITRDNTSRWIIVEVGDNGKFKAAPKDKVFPKANYLSEDLGYKEIPANRVYKDIDAEQFDISGKVDTSNPIYRFYEKDLQKYLKRFEGKRVTDENGVDWMEVPITKDYANNPVDAFGKIGINPLTVGAGVTGLAAFGSAVLTKDK